MVFRKTKFVLLLGVIFLLAATAVFADSSDDDSTGLDLSVGVTAKDLTLEPAFGLDFGLAYQFEMWGYDIGVGADALEWYFTPENELNLGIYYWYGKYIGESAFSYYSAGEYMLRFLGEYNYDGAYIFGIAYDFDDVKLACLDIVWTYYEEVTMNSAYSYGSREEIQTWLADTKLDTAIGAGYEFTLDKAGALNAWLDITLRFFDEQWGFWFYSLNPKVSYTYYITDYIPVSAGVDFNLLPKDGWANEFSASISLALEL